MLGLVPVKRLSARSAASASRRRPLFRDVMHVVRRVHLYSGLFMFPWVMLYGVTALFFNHPGAFPDQPRQALSLADFSGTALAEIPSPAVDAENVVAALNAKLGAEGSLSDVRLALPDRARYARDRVAARVRGDGQEHAVLYDLPSGTATITTEEQSQEARAPFAMRGLKVPGSLAERLKAGLPAALARQGLAAEEAGVAVGTDLVFYVQANGRLWKANYSIQTGAVTGSPADGASDLSTRSFLTQLHLSHGYPPKSGVRWAWALAVDAMLASMLFWGLSGVFMWWQLKAVRTSGTLVFVVGALTATVVAVLMHGVLSA